LLYVDHHPATLARDKNFNATLLAALREALAPEIVAEAATWGKAKQVTRRQHHCNQPKR
jgi:hypothetical protein